MLNWISLAISVRFWCGRQVNNVRSMLYCGTIRFWRFYARSIFEAPKVQRYIFHASVVSSKKKNAIKIQHLISLWNLLAGWCQQFVWLSYCLRRRNAKLKYLRGLEDAAATLCYLHDSMFPLPWPGWSTLCDCRSSTPVNSSVIRK